MKTIIFRLLLIVWLTGSTLTASAALDYSWTGTQDIPDNNGSGLAYGFNLSDSATSITDIAVTLDFSGGYNGDLYVYLSHGDSFVVLLNRVGRTSSSEYGYYTPGMDVTLTSGSTADIHNYQTYNPVYNTDGQLTGTWGADGRVVTPGTAYDTSDRTTFGTLAGLTGVNPNGDWILYFRDTSPGGISTLNSWSLEITAVPEPVNVALGVFAVVGLLVQGRRLGWNWWQRRNANGNGLE